jgi:Zn-dependent M28 family amino/carboxypeptidase
MQRSVKIFSIIIFSFVIINGCKQDKPSEEKTETPAALPPLPDFNADSAYAFIKAQCSFGPRVPNTPAHAECAEYYIVKMSEWCDTVIVQTGIVTTFDNNKLNFKNIIGIFNPQAQRRILLFAHWDTRPWTDQDTANTDKPSLGADDGASGVAVLMELARQLKNNKISIGIDMIFFDAEDWGKSGGGPGSEDSYSLATQYWTKNPHVKNYKADYGILLDMVGARGARFRKEGLSKDQAGFVVDKVWSMASRLGYSGYFLYEDGGWVTDDHVYVNKYGIPSIDIINSMPGTKHGFAPHWHTHQDNMDIIDQSTLKAVGQTLVGVIYGEAL